MAGTRLLIISSFLVPFVLYVTYVITICWDDFPYTSTSLSDIHEIQVLQDHVHSYYDWVRCTIICPLTQTATSMKGQKQQQNSSSSIVNELSARLQLPVDVSKQGSSLSQLEVPVIVEPLIVFVLSSSSLSSLSLSSSLLSIIDESNRRQQTTQHDNRVVQQQYQTVEFDGNTDQHYHLLLQQICSNNNKNNKNYNDPNSISTSALNNMATEIISHIHDHKYINLNHTNTTDQNNTNNTNRSASSTTYFFICNDNTGGNTDPNGTQIPFLLLSDSIGIIYITVNTSKDNRKNKNSSSNNTSKNMRSNDNNENDHILTKILSYNTPHYIAAPGRKPSDLPSRRIKDLYITIVIDPSITNWKDYIFYIQQWVDIINQQHNSQNRQVFDHISLLSNICTNHYHAIPQNIVVRTIQRHDLFDHYTAPATMKSPQYRYLSIATIQDMLLSPNTSDQLLYQYGGTTDDDSMIFYVPSKTTYFHLSTDHHNNETTTATTSSSIKLSLGEGLSSSLLYMSIMNPKKSTIYFDDTEDIATQISSILDSLYNSYFVDCLNIPTIPATTAPTSPTTNSFFIRLFYQRTFYLWYQHLINEIRLIDHSVALFYHQLILHHDETRNKTCRLFSDEMPYIPQDLPIIYKQLHEMIVSAPSITMIMKNCFLEVADTIICYQKIYSYLERMDGLVYDMVHIIQDVVRYQEQHHNSKGTSITTPSYIDNINNIINEFPIEQYFAVFGPLLFPLLLPMIISFIREYIRYRKLTKKKKEDQKGKVDAPIS